MHMQKTKGLLTAQVTLNGGKINLLRSVTSHLPKSVKILDTVEIPGPNNQNDISFSVEYGPVWGGWASDIKSHFTRAAVAAGTKANIEIDRVKRVIVETRA